MLRRNRTDHISEEEVKQLLVESENSEETKRLLVVFEYLNGADVAQLSEQFGVERTTIQYWIDRFAYDTPENALSE